jgi:hypothetical protein
VVAGQPGAGKFKLVVRPIETDCYTGFARLLKTPSLSPNR